MSEQECTCPPESFGPGGMHLSPGWDDGCPKHGNPSTESGTIKGTKPPLNVDNDAQNVQDCRTSQYAETVPESGNGVLTRTKPEPLVQDTDANQYRPWEAEGITGLAYFKRRYLEARAESSLPDDGVLRDVGNVVERLEADLKEVEAERAIHLYGDAIKRTVAEKRILLDRDALALIHDFQKKVEFGKDLLEIWTGHYDKAAAEGRKLEAENARLREQIAGAKEAYDEGRMGDLTEALTGEQGGSRFVNDEQEQK